MSYNKSIDGYESREDEPIITEEYKTYLKWIDYIKSMCDENHLVSKAIGEKTEFEDDMEEAYYDPEYDENTMDHYLLDNGLHVYIRNGEIRIQDVEGINYAKPQTFMELRNNNISFFIGAEGTELPYSISYSENQIYGNLPLRGLMREQSNIKDILESSFNYYLREIENKSEISNSWVNPSQGKTIFESSIALYDKISNIVKTFQQQKSNNTSKLEQREFELSLLEKEERTISETEILIDQQRPGQNIGEE